MTTRGQHAPMAQPPASPPRATRTIGYCILPFEPNVWFTGRDDFAGLERGFVEAERAGLEGVEVPALSQTVSIDMSGAARC